MNGNGHSVYSIMFYTGKVPDEWIEQVKLLTSMHSFFDNTGQPVRCEAIASLDFHYWAAKQISQVDPSFSYEEKLGRGTQAEAIQEAVQLWVAQP